MQFVLNFIRVNKSKSKYWKWVDIVYNFFNAVYNLGQEKWFFFNNIGRREYKIYRQNTSIGPLSFTFVSDKSFKFFKYQIGPSNFLSYK